MNSQIRFGCTALLGSNLVGNLRKDADGYYEMVVGALNIFNSQGSWYQLEESRRLFEDDSSALMRRVQRGALRGEYGHPKMLPGMSRDDFAHRVMQLYEDMICCHFKSITLDFDRIKDDQGRPVVAIIAKVCPSGPYSQALERSLQNKDENVCFSVRSFTHDFMDRGIIKRILKTVVTFDYVNEPGIAVANKYAAPGLEGLVDAVPVLKEDDNGIVISHSAMQRVVRKAQNQIGMGNESALLNADELFRGMGWQTSDGSSILKPAWKGW